MYRSAIERARNRIGKIQVKVHGKFSMDGVAISVHDRFEELGVLVDIVRENWENDYHITVCSSHENGREQIEEADIPIDAYVQGGRISYRPSMEPPRDTFNLAARVIDNVALACKRSIETGVDTVFHLHADAWPLSEESYLELRSRLRNRPEKLAVRGYGVSWRNAHFPLGHVHDQFFLVDAEFAAKRDLFDFNPIGYFPDWSMHSSLLLIMIGRAGFHNIWFYSNMDTDIQWDGEPVDVKDRYCPGIRPGVFNPEYELLHIAADEFPGDLGKGVQVHWLNKHGPWKGDHITKFIEDHFQDDTIEEIERWESQMETELRSFGYKPESFKRQFSRMTATLEDAKESPVRTRLANYWDRIKYDFVKDRLFVALSKLPIEEFRHLGDRRKREYYHDSGLWMESTEDRYRELIRPSDFPDEMVEWIESRE